MQTKETISEETVEQDVEQTEEKPEEDIALPKMKRKNPFKKASQKIMSPVIKVLNGIEADYSDRSQFRQSLISLLKLRVPICIILVIVVLLSGSYFFFESTTVATTEMSLNYEEGAYGLNPNSTRFNVYDVASHDVVSNMLTYCGIDPDSVDINSVIDCISISPMNAKTFTEDDLFISTTFKIKMKKPDQIKGVSVKTMLNFLCKAYKDNLYLNYTENRSILGFDVDRFNDEEFLVIADLLDLKAQQIEKYLNTRVKQSKSFTEQETDETFKSLSQKAEDIRLYDIAKYRSFVIESGCSYDKATYTRALSYVNRIKNIDYSKNIAAYTVFNNGIKLYNEAMINVVMIPSVDQEKNAYYMSRTKTGMDYMAKQSDDYLIKAQEIEKEISVNENIIKKISGSDNKAANIEKANSMIDSIRSKFSDLSKQIEMIDKAYIKYKTKDYLTFKNHSSSFVQKLRPTTLAVIALAVICVIFLAIWLRFWLRIGGRKK